MKPFSKIFEEWERLQPESFTDGSPSGPAAHPPRNQMEAAPVEGRLDLHGLSSQDAEEAVRQFLGDSQRQGMTKVLVIHGQGLHSDGKAVLKEMVNRVLRKNRHVAAWGEARKGEGGLGASWVWLRGTIVPER